MDLWFKLCIYVRVKEHHLQHSIPHEQNTSATIQSSSCSVSVVWKSLLESHNSIPSFGINQIIEYFVYRNDSDGLERQDWKNVNSGGYKLFKEGHVYDLFTSFSHNTFFIKGKCLPEMKKDRVYVLKVQINIDSSSVTKAECTCPAGCGPTGSCKHIAALCFAIEDFIRTRDTALSIECEGQISCTSVLQQWNRPRKRRLDSKMVEDISFRNEKYACEPKRSPAEVFDPRPSTLQRTTKADIQEFTDSINSLTVPCVFIHLLSKPTESDNSKDMLPLIPRSVKAKICSQMMQLPLPPSFECVQQLGQQFISGITPSDSQRQLIEKKTRLQSECVRWHEERYCRLTASNFGRVIQRKSEFNKLALELLSTKNLSNVPAIKWGKDHELEAFHKYKEGLDIRYPNMLLRKSGIVIGDIPYLAASPDGILTDELGEVRGIIEIKCPYSAAKLTINEACKQLDNFYLSKVEETFILRANHLYYFQIQGTMALVGAKFCDFVVWTPKSFEVISINFETSVWKDEMLPKLTAFYVAHMLPAILY